MGAPAAVAAAYIHSDEVAYSWHHSMLQMLMMDMARGRALACGGVLSAQCGPAGIAKARNEVAEAFLGVSADWLLWLDTDMGFHPDTCERLLAAADPAKRPVMGALCFTQRQLGPDGMGGWRCAAVPAIRDWAQPGDPWGGFKFRRNYPPDAVTRCAGTGAACLLVHRSVFERINAKFGPAWYDMLPSPVPGELISEDLSFCARAGALRIPVHVHTGVPTSHMKRTWLGEGDYQRERAADGLPAGFPVLQRA